MHNPAHPFLAARYAPPPGARTRDRVVEARPTRTKCRWPERVGGGCPERTVPSAPLFGHIYSQGAAYPSATATGLLGRGGPEYQAPLARAKATPPLST